MNPDTPFQRADLTKTRAAIPNLQLDEDEDHGSNVCQPKSRVIEISADGQKWTIRDQRKDNYDLNGRSFCWTFDIANVEGAQFIRLRQIGPNHQGDRYLVIAALGFFG
jgi:hypothetical protein